MEGRIEVADIPELWDAKMQQWLGLSTKGNYQNGCMQDIHWTDGSFGYFPSYTLGAMYAAQLRFALERELGDMGTLVELSLIHIFCRGDGSRSRQWASRRAHLFL